jgi:predicted esterase
MESRTIATLTHGTYLVEPPSEGPAEGAPLLVGFHGYGENAAVHLAELARIPGSGRWLRCAVQGLHLFYNRSQEVVASWMTRHERERAIEDNVRYVAAVVAEVKRERGAGETLVYAGFSQGASMAHRAAAASGHACAGVVALGGDVPPELTRRDLSGYPPVLIGRGTREEWYSAEKLARDVELLRSSGVDVRPLLYEGGHEWTPEFRRAMGDFLGEVLAPKKQGALAGAP